MNVILKIIGSIVIFFAISSIGAYDYRVGAVIGDMIYSLILFNLKEENKLKNYLILLTPILFIEGLVRVLNLEDTFFSLPPFIFKLIPFVIFLFVKGNAPKKIAFISTFIITVSFNVFFYDNWSNYSSHGTFNGQTKTAELLSFSLTNKTAGNNSLEINKHSGIIVIDFWTESCGICYQKFPKVKELKDMYSVNKNIQFITALNPKKLNYRDFANEVDSIYNFKTYITDEALCNQLKIAGYPTILILIGNKIIFKGSVELLKDFMISEEFKILLP